MHGVTSDTFFRFLGANRLQTFTKITLPLLKPILLYVLINGRSRLKNRGQLVLSSQRI